MNLLIMGMEFSSVLATHVRNVIQNPDIRIYRPTLLKSTIALFRVLGGGMNIFARLSNRYVLRHDACPIFDLWNQLFYRNLPSGIANQASHKSNFRMMHFCFTP